MIEVPLWGIIGSLITLCVFFGSCFFWLWTRFEGKRAEDKATFVAIYERLRVLDSRVAFLFGRGGHAETDTISGKA